VIAAATGLPRERCLPLVTLAGFQLPTSS